MNNEKEDKFLELFREAGSELDRKLEDCTDTLKVDRILEEIRLGGHLTGSRAWGVESEESDWDYFMEESKYFSFLPLVGHLDIDTAPGSSVFDSIRISLNGEEYNIWPVKREYIDSWLKCTEAMAILSQNGFREPMKIKHKRVAMFEALRNALGAKGSELLK